MPTKRVFIKHIFGGGWATDLGPNFEGVPDGDSKQIVIPFLTKAENVMYDLDGGPIKIPGISKLNSSALESGANVMGIFDYWKQGTSGSPTQHRIAHVGTKIVKDDGDASFTDLFTGLTADAIPNYFVLEDLLIMCNDVTGDVPKSWDGSTAQNLAGSPPDFSFGTTHVNKAWAAGVDAKPSRLYYSVSFAPDDWAGAGSGHIDIDPSDGDRITGIVSHQNSLFVFKGPYKGSIHRITGTAPTGDDGFARTTYIRGVGAVNHNSIFTFRDDIGFVWSDGTVKSLSATQRFGDFSENSLSLPINRGYLRDQVNFGNLHKAWAVNNESDGFVLLTIPAEGSSDPNVVLMIDYRFEPVRWAKWPEYSDVFSLASVIDPTDNDRRIVMAGHGDGFIRKWLQPTADVDGSSGIAYEWKTPFLNYGMGDKMKTLTDMAVGFEPKNASTVTLGWTRDDNAEQTIALNQGGATDVLGNVAENEFTLGTSALGGSRYIDQFTPLDEEGGEFRAIQYGIRNSGVGEDVAVHTFGASISLGAESMENSNGG